jgi:shikimate kinase
MSYSCKKELLVLVGPMGAGKSTIGKILAQELGYEFLDSDKVIEERCGADIPWIFDVEGEAGFRDREAVVIKDLSMKKKTVLATGGGAMMRQENRDYITRTGYVIYLNTSVEQQFHRTSKDKNRPLLQGENDNAFDVLSNLMEVRDPLYRDVADLVIDTDRKNLKLVVARILQDVCDAG